MQMDQSGEGADPFLERRSIVDGKQVRQVIGDEHQSGTFGPFDLAEVRRDYGRCDDGLGGGMSQLGKAHAATGSVVVTDQREPGTVAEVLSIVARMPGADEADLVADGRRDCGAAPGTPVTVTLGGNPMRATRLDVGGPADPLKAIALTSRVGPDVVVVLVAFNGEAPGDDVSPMLSRAYLDAVELLQQQ